MLEAKDFPVRLLKAGRKTLTRTAAETAAKKANNIDSPKNCRIISGRLPPTTFLIPTSLARIVERAVERFMKLMQAIRITIRATTENT
ncbi:MAG: hypothetical protein WBB73_16820 [Candidatus Aminicenantaceae bacterium]